MKTFKLKFLTGVFALISLYVSAQQTYVNKEWEYIGGIPGQYDYVQSRLHSNGNLILVGNNTNNGQTDILVTALNGNGTIVWQQTNSGANGQNDYGTDLAIDNSGNILVCGAVHNGSNVDYRVIKYSADGSLIWTKQYNGTGNGDDVPVAIRIDSGNNIYVTGTSTGNGTLTDYATLKYDQSGILLWTKRYNFSNLPEVATCLEIDNNGNIFVAGASASSLNNSDFCVVKYNSVGTQLVAQRYTTTGNGYDLPSEMTINNSGNIFIVGTSESGNNKDIKLLAITSTLTALWTQYIDQFGRDDEGYSIALTQSNNIVITGYSKKQSNGTNLIVAKYTSTGTQVWLKNKTALIDNEIAKGRKIRVNVNGGIMVSGECFTQNTRDLTTICYDEDGGLRWEKKFDNSNSIEKASQMVISNEDVYVTGTTNDGSSEKFATIKYSTTEKPYNVAGNGDTLWNDNEIIVMFDTSAIIRSTIDKIDINYGLGSDFIKPNVIALLTQKTGISWGKMQVFRIFRNTKTSDSISISRLNDAIIMPSFWADLSVFIPSNYDESDIIDSLLEIKPFIKMASKNHLNGRIFSSDPLEIEQSSLFLQPTYPYSHINVKHAWQYSVGHPSIKVGIFDFPVYWAHEDFGDGTFLGSVFKNGGYDYFYNTDILNITAPSSSHGTSCAGIIGAKTHNEIGVSGIAGGDAGVDGVNMLSYGIYGEGSFVGSTDVADAIVRGASSISAGGDELNIQNHSWGETSYNPLIEKAVISCWKNNCTLVAARGNKISNENPDAFPAIFKDEMVLSVGASGFDGKAVSCYPPYNNHDDGFCNYTTSIWASGQQHIDFIAPGSTINVTSTIFSNAPYNYANGCTSAGYSKYQCFNGTSSSAPHVSGTAALMVSLHNTNNGYNNNLSPEDIENILQNTAYNYSSPGYVTAEDGFGLINAGTAVEQVNAPNYRVYHSTDNPLTRSINGFPNTFTAFVGNTNWNNYFNNYSGPTNVEVEVDRYNVLMTFQDVFDVGEEGFEYWKRLNNSAALDLNLSPSNPENYWGINYITGKPNFILVSPVYSGNTFSCTTSTYCYHVKKVVSTNEIIDQWIPCHWSKLKTLYSVHVRKDILSSPVNELELNDFRIFPVPSNEVITINIFNNSRHQIFLEIFDITGKLIYSTTEFSGQENISIDYNVNSLPQGVYYCKVIFDNSIVTKPFSKL